MKKLLANLLGFMVFARPFLLILGNRRTLCEYLPSLRFFTKIRLRHFRESPIIYHVERQ
jgi:hypothetical protein